MKKGKIDGNPRNAWCAKFTGLLSLLGVVSFIIAGAPHADAEKFTSGTEQAPLTPTLKTGDYVWKPAVSPAGPVVIIVSIPEQTLFVYRNGVRIGRSTVSTGKSGHRTPTGVFTILQKNEKHTSSIYKGASMPYMQRLTWTGVALHAGNLPGYPASHGCVRLPLDFAQKLYTVTDKGTTVVVTDGKTKTGTTSRPGLLFASGRRRLHSPQGNSYGLRENHRRVRYRYSSAARTARLTCIGTGWKLVARKSAGAMPRFPPGATPTALWQ